MGTQSLVKKSSNQCYSLLSYKLLCSFPWLLVLENIFLGTSTSPATPWFGLKIPEVTNVFITFNWKHKLCKSQLGTQKENNFKYTYIYIYIYILYIISYIYIYTYTYIYIKYQWSIYEFLYSQLLYGLESKLLRLQTYSLPSINCEANLPYSACFLRSWSTFKKRKL